MLILSENKIFYCLLFTVSLTFLNTDPVILYRALNIDGKSTKKILCEAIVCRAHNPHFLLVASQTREYKYIYSRLAHDLPSPDCSLVRVGGTRPPLSLYLPSQAKLWCTLQLRGQKHSSYFSSTLFSSVGCMGAGQRKWNRRILCA